MKKKHVSFAYIALSRTSAWRIIEPIVEQLRRDYGVKVELLESKGIVKLIETNSTIEVHGADLKGYERKLHGRRFEGVCIDEAAKFTSDLEHIVNEAIRPTLMDAQGTLYMISTPSYYENYFYDVETNKDGKYGDWSRSNWTALDNPYMEKQVALEMANARKYNPKVDEEPWFRTQFLGEWVIANEDQVYHGFNLEKNIHVGEYPHTFGNQYTLGIDYGYADSTAFSLIGFNDDISNVLVEIESYKQPKMNADEIALKIDYYMNKYPDLDIVHDTASRQFAEEVQSRFDHISMYPSQKLDKRGWISMVNTDLQKQEIMIADSNEDHIKEMRQLMWADSKRGNVLEQPGQPNDLCDAFLYAYRHCYPQRDKEKQVSLIPNSKEYYDKMARDMKNRRIQEVIDRVGSEYE